MPTGSAANPALLALNNLHAEELSLLDLPELAFLLENAWHAVAAGDASALLIAFDQDAPYSSPNFLWFRARYGRFVYVDRVVVASQARGTGIARRMYRGLLAKAAASGHTLVCCEVNVAPPNPGSDRFHAALGFREAGRAVLAGRNRTVSYLVRGIGEPPAPG